LEGKQTDLRPVAVGDDELVMVHEPSERVGCDPDVVTLVLGGQGLATTEQGVAAQGDDDSHQATHPRGRA
jgi:hypothetical protein